MLFLIRFFNTTSGTPQCLLRPSVAHCRSRQIRRPLFLHIHPSSSTARHPILFAKCWRTIRILRRCRGVDSASHPFRKHSWRDPPAHSAFRRPSFASISQSLPRPLSPLGHFDGLSDRMASCRLVVQCLEHCCCAVLAAPERPGIPPRVKHCPDTAPNRPKPPGNHPEP